MLTEEALRPGFVSPQAHRLMYWLPLATKGPGCSQLGVGCWQEVCVSQARITLSMPGYLNPPDTCRQPAGKTH